MDSSLRSAKGMQNEIDRLQSNLLRRFTNLVALAKVKSTDRGVSATAQYQLQAETAALIRGAEEVQTLIRQMQEMWLFGQLNTLGESKIQQETDENARAVAGLLRELTEKGFGEGEGEVNGVNGTNGTGGRHEG
ncbi:hypothetical protein CBER1_09632 [Cercospora berteroae]|uniref:Mediator of RNA polymerase II transcription subunit 22 n=1 Tax=Cercospora berteroae TaxID=357750 RepID=A0A2S6BWY7_9PEZI|nr:hypothetical protein CBER1_09632 [Cercospora berteroae]